jgi:hypothetical protein
MDWGWLLKQQIPFTDDNKRDKDKCNRNPNCNRRSLRDDNKKTTATEETTADSFGMNPKRQRQQQRQQQIRPG